MRRSLIPQSRPWDRLDLAVKSLRFPAPFQAVRDERTRRAANFSLQRNEDLNCETGTLLS